MALLGPRCVDYWHRCFRALRSDFDDPLVEKASTQNCWSWTLKRFFLAGGAIVISHSPRAAVYRCEWIDPSGRRWHFEPLKPKRGIAGIWHAYMHRGVPRLMTK